MFSSLSYVLSVYYFMSSLSCRCPVLLTVLAVADDDNTCIILYCIISYHIPPAILSYIIYVPRNPSPMSTQYYLVLLLVDRHTFCQHPHTIRILFLSNYMPHILSFPFLSYATLRYSTLLDSTPRYVILYVVIIKFFHHPYVVESNYAHMKAFHIISDQIRSLYFSMYTHYPHPSAPIYRCNIALHCIAHHIISLAMSALTIR
jgi:hypothetical protein